MSLHHAAAVLPGLRVGLLPVVLLLASPAVAAPPAAPPSALFALVIGVNRNPEPEQAALHYADDDAVRYVELFRSLGARTTLLSTLDENTRAVHPRAVAEARPARKEELRRAVAALAQEIQGARARGARSVFYVIYAGHGDDDGARPALTLEDGSLGADQLLAEVVTPAGADDTHVIIDACHAYLFALPRGPGGERRPSAGFVDRAARHAGDPEGRVGFLLASSINGDSHEWAGFEAGVFSHEVRSGLYGAADADGDGLVTYDEIGAFVTRANASITAEKYRPQIIARPPAQSGTLLDLRPHRRELVFAGKEAAGHFLLEDAAGVRVVDFHAGGNIPTVLVRPSEGVVYVRRLPSEEERAVPLAGQGVGVLGVLDLPLEPPRTKPRGAAAHAFAQTFALPFGEDAVVAYGQQQRAEDDAARRELTRSRARTVGTVAFGASGASLVVAGSFALAARAAAEGTSMDTGMAMPAMGTSQAEIASRNDTIRTRNAWATGALIGAGVTALVGTILFWKF